MVDRIHGRFYTDEQLSEHRALTPEGFLLVSAVPIARTGQQVYAAHELPALQPSSDGLIIVDRNPEDVFRPETIASFNGKPLTDDHPTVGMLTPDSWRNFARGTVLNPRRGDGLKLDSDFLFADILVTDRDAIQAIQDGKKEVSAGYDADYEALGPGRARCLDIVGNHVALVAKGRCGPHCAIGDSQFDPNSVRIVGDEGRLANTLGKVSEVNYSIGDNAMAAKSATSLRFMDRFRSAVIRGSTRDALEAVSEVARQPELLGEIISDEMGSTTAPEVKSDPGGHHIEVHSHFNGVPGQGATPAAATQDDPVAPAAAASNGGDVGAQIAALTQRLDKIEQMLMSLAEGEQAEQGDPSGVGDRRVKDSDLIGKESEWPKSGDEQQGSGYHEEKSAPDLPQESPGTADRRGTADHRAAVMDSAAMRELFIATLSRAESLCPGIRLPTFDSASPAKDTADALCSFRRKTMDAAYKNDDTRAVIDSVIDGRKAQFFDRAWTCDAVTMAFNASASLVAQKNQRAAHPRVGGNGGNNGFGARPPTPAELNAKNLSFNGWQSR